MKNVMRNIIRKRGLLALGLPGILLLLTFNYLPMFGVFIGFKSIDYQKGIFKSPWVGLKNFKFFFQSQDALRITRNTVCLNIVFITLTIVLSIIFALLLYELSKGFVKVYQTILFIPYLLSWVVISYVVEVFLNYDYGTINRFLTSIGVENINWYGEAQIWPAILTVAYIFKNVGYTTIIFYTGLISIDPSYFEAAAIDGASKFQQKIKIAIPLITPLICMILILNIGKIFYSDFGMFYFTTKNSALLYPTTDVIDTYVFRTLRNVGEPGMAAAVGLYQSIVGFILVLVSNFIIKKINPDNAMF